MFGHRTLLLVDGGRNYNLVRSNRQGPRTVGETRPALPQCPRCDPRCGSWRQTSLPGSGDGGCDKRLAVLSSGPRAVRPAYQAWGPRPRKRFRPRRLGPLLLMASPSANYDVLPGYRSPAHRSVGPSVTVGTSFYKPLNRHDTLPCPWGQLQDNEGHGQASCRRLTPR
jgi:hypothetical protein